MHTRLDWLQMRALSVTPRGDHPAVGGSFVEPVLQVKLNRPEHEDLMQAPHGKIVSLDS